MEDLVFNYSQILRKIIQCHAEGNTSTETAIEANAEICKEFFRLLNNDKHLDFTFPMDIYTFRNRRGKIFLALRTIRSNPPFLAEIFNDPEDRYPFTRENFNEPVERECSIKGHKIVVELFSSECDPNKINSNKFYWRILDFLDHKLPERLNILSDKIGTHDPGNNQESCLSLQEIEKLRNTVDKLQKSWHCLVIGRIVDNKNELDDQLHDLFAIYSVEKPTITRENLNDVKFFQCLWFTFTAFEEIEKQDRAIFRRKALRVINQRINSFANRENAPAANMANLLQELQNSCQKHPSMGCGTKKHDIAVKFVRVNFFDQEKDTIVIPQQSVYPPADTDAYVRSTIVFSHRNSKTVVKHLLGKWGQDLDWTIKSPFGKYSLDKDFIDTYLNSDGTTIDPSVFGEWINDSENRTIGIYATNKDNSFWSDLNYSKDINTTAAFLIINNKIKIYQEIDNDLSKIPYGIIAFESQVQDAFSNDDLKVFEDIAEGVGSLLDIADFGSSFVDFSRRLREATTGYSFADDIKFGNFVYELQRLNPKLLKSLVVGGPSDHLNFIREKIPQIPEYTKLHDSFAWLFDGSNSWPWSDQWFQKKYEDEELEIKWSKDTSYSQLLAFLEAIPSNENWHARLSSIPRALSARRIKDPILNKFPAGFSADSIYILSQTGEINQVLKFSDMKSIKREREAYQRFVRYNIPLAARMPTTGFAVESDGKDSFGVLVSDLIAGFNDGPQQNVKSLIDLLVDKIKRDARGKDLTDFLVAVAHHFIENTTRWNNPQGVLESDRDCWVKSNKIQNIIKDSSRIKLMDTGESDYRGPSLKLNEEFIKNHHHKILALFIELLNISKLSLKQFDSRAQRTSEADNLRLKPSDKPLNYNKLELLFNAWKDHLSLNKEVLTNREQLISVIHGDLNPQNMTWSKSYKKFQIIDFEHVRFGYRGSDQLKLIFSILLNLHQRGISEGSESQNLLKNISFNVECGLYVIYALAICLRRTTINDEETPFLDPYIFLREFTLTSFSGNPTSGRKSRRTDQSLPLGILFKIIIRTLFTPSTDNLHSLKGVQRIHYFNHKKTWQDEIEMMKLALQCFSLKEISYALKELSEEDAKRIEYWTAEIKKITDKNDDACLSLLLSEFSSEASNEYYNSDKRVSSLICSFLAYTAVYFGLGLEFK